MTFKLCNDGMIRNEHNSKIGEIRKTKDGFFFYTDYNFPLFDHEVDYLWDQFDNNREAFDLQHSKRKFEPPTIERVSRDSLEILSDLDMGVPPYLLSFEDLRVMEDEFGPDWEDSLGY